jgi:hypothetical protein
VVRYEWATVWPLVGVFLPLPYSGYLVLRPNTSVRRARSACHGCMSATLWHGALSRRRPKPGQTRARYVLYNVYIMPQARWFGMHAAARRGCRVRRGAQKPCTSTTITTSAAGEAAPEVAGVEVVLGLAAAGSNSSRAARTGSAESVDHRTSAAAPQAQCSRTSSSTRGVLGRCGLTGFTAQSLCFAFQITAPKEADERVHRDTAGRCGR